jgi:hypothetical protein
VAAARVRALLYGYAGSGKTTAAGTAADDPRTSPVLYCATYDAGISAIAGKPRIQVVDIKKTADLEEIGNHLEKNPDDFKCVVFDTLTGINELNLAEVVKTRLLKKPDGLATPQIDDYLTSEGQMKQILRFFYSLPMHVVIVAHAQEVIDEQDRSVAVKPALVGQLRDKVPAIPDIVGYLGVMKRVEGDKVIEERQLIIAQQDRFPSAKLRDRRKMTHPPLVDPTIGKLLDIVEASVAAA